MGLTKSKMERWARRGWGAVAGAGGSGRVAPRGREGAARGGRPAVAGGRAGPGAVAAATGAARPGQP